MSMPPSLVRHRLVGCQPEPLGSYLKALGILRLVASQADVEAAGFWDADGFVLDAALEEDAIEAFFMDRYQPTPILSPWNNSAGFGPEGKEELGAIETSSDARLGVYRQAVQEARRLMARAEWDGWSKEERLVACRSELPDGCLPWIDAAAVLTDGNKLVYPPILGTGGNDGRLEFSRNFHKRVLDVLGHTPKASSKRQQWLRASLYGHEADLPATGSPGQFDAGGAGGPNSSPLGASDSLLNPWDWVLLIEGSVLFAAGAARRLATDRGGRAAAPFTVSSSPVGYGSAGDSENSRGEIWLPLWTHPASLREVRSLFAEGRLDWRERHARSGLDAVKAVASLGVDRGVDSFSRHALLERNGLATVATPVGRVSVSDRREQVAPLAALDRWLDRLRSSNLPAEVETALRAAEQAEFALAAGRGQILDVLVGASRLDRAVGRSPAAQERVKQPLKIPGKGSNESQDWARALLGSASAVSNRPELRLALSFASARDRPADSTIRALLTPDWVLGKPAPVMGLGSRPISDVLADAHARRVVELMKASRSTGTDEQTGVNTRFEYGTPAPLGDVAAWVLGDLDEALLGVLVEACLVLDLQSQIEWGRLPDEGVLPPELCLLAPFYAKQPAGDPAEGPQLASRFSRRLVPEAEWAALLASGRAGPVLRAAHRRLRIAEMSPVPRPTNPVLDPTTARRLGAALLLPQRSSTRNRLLSRVCPDSVDDSDNQ